MIKWGCLLFIFIAQALAASEIWYIEDNYFPIEQEAVSKKMISKDCNSKKCQAYLALKDESKKPLTSDELKGGKNPGAVVCKKYFNGRVLILKDSKGNENAFCFFKDGSLLSASALIR